MMTILGRSALTPASAPVAALNDWKHRARIPVIEMVTFVFIICSISSPPRLHKGREKARQDKIRKLSRAMTKPANQFALDSIKSRRILAQTPWFLHQSFRLLVVLWVAPAGRPCPL